jgi:putative MATE family efflux protein
LIDFSWPNENSTRPQFAMQDLTTGSLARHLVKTSSFMLVTMVFQTLYFLVDLYWVGRLGRDAVAAVGVAGNLMFVVLAATQMLGVGTTALVSHAVGRKDHDRAQFVFGQSQMLSLVVGLAFLAVMMAARPVYATRLSADAATAALASDYLLWFIPAMSLQFGLVAMGAALRATGNFKPGMIVQTVSVITNMVLAPLLMFGWAGLPRLGVAGTALASLVAVAVAVVWMSFYFRAPSYLTFSRVKWKPEPATWSALLKIGLPAGAEFALMAVYLMIVYALIKPFGAAAQAGFGIGQRIVQAGFMPVVALGFAAGPVAGQNFGARLAARVRGTFTIAASMAAGVMLIFATVCLLAPATLVRVFSSDPGVIAIGEEYLRIATINFVASGIVFVSSSMFQAMGNTVPSLVSSFSRVLLFAIPAVVLSRRIGFDLRWLWYLSAGSIVIQMLLNLLLLRVEFRNRLNFGPALIP